MTLGLFMPRSTSLAIFGRRIDLFKLTFCTSIKILVITLDSGRAQDRDPSYTSKVRLS
jgi:hypothetical protein